MNEGLIVGKDKFLDNAIDYVQISLLQEGK